MYMFKKKDKKQIVKPHPRYKFSFFNENTLEEVWTIRFSRTGATVSVIIGCILFISLIAAIMIGTPVKYLLPGYLQSKDRAEMVDNILRLDSLAEEVAIKDSYLQNMSNILLGKIEIDSIPYVGTDSVWSMSLDALISSSEREKQFIEQYEQEEKYTLNVLDNVQASKSVLFHAPVNGVLKQKFNPNEEFFGIGIQTANNATVSAVSDGTIIAAYYTLNHGYVAVVQHDDMYVSIYRNNTGLLKQVGDHVVAGERIARIDRQKVQQAANDKLAEFQLWRNGKPLDPEEYILF